MTNVYVDGEYARRHPDWHRGHSAWKAGQVLSMLRRNQLIPSCVAEVGCGAGGILASLQRELPPAAELTGYDIAPEALELALPLENERLHFVLGDFLGLSSSRFDLLLAMDVVEHVEDYIGFLRALRPRAAAHVFHLPLDLSLLSAIQPARLKWAYESVGHVHYFTAETALAALANAGYNVTDWFFTAVELDLPPPAGQHQRLRPIRRLGRRIDPAWTARILGGFSILVLCK